MGQLHIFTQSIEATWSACKRQMRHLQGIARDDMPAYLYNYMFRRAHKQDGCDHNELFRQMLYWIRSYNGFN